MDIQDYVDDGNPMWSYLFLRQALNDAMQSVDDPWNLAFTTPIGSVESCAAALGKTLSKVNLRKGTVSRCTASGVLQGRDVEIEFFYPTSDGVEAVWLSSDESEIEASDLRAIATELGTQCIDCFYNREYKP